MCVCVCVRARAVLLTVYAMLPRVAKDSLNIQLLSCGADKSIMFRTLEVSETCTQSKAQSVAPCMYTGGGKSVSLFGLQDCRFLGTLLCVYIHVW